MKTMHHTQQTSIWAYIALADLGARQRAVYNAIQTLGKACNAQIANYLDLPINQITGRTMELREKGLVEEAYRDKWEPTNKIVIYWQAKL